MARQLRIEYPNAFYHITSRGNEQKNIFKNDRDREKFLSYLESATERYGAAIHVYCLMNNHYHLLLETPKGNLSEIMRHINGAYTSYYNAKRDRSGHLLQGRYKAILIEADEYAKELSRYIHQNPVRVEAVKKPQDYPWSSYQNYCGEKKANREVPALRKLNEQISIEQIEKATEAVFGKEEKTRKKVSIYLSHRFSGKKLKEIGKYFGVSESGVTQASRRLEKNIEEDKKLKKKVGLTKSRLNL